MRVKPLLCLGVGEIARAVHAARPTGLTFGTTRGAPDARFQHIQALSAYDHDAIRRAAEGADVLVSFPPDGHGDVTFTALVSNAASLVYLSSTAVYPAHAAHVNEETEIAPESERARRRAIAESVWLARGARVLRLPAFYGPETGLHVSIARGTFRIPGAGTNIVSRVHVDDAARFVLAAFTAPEGSILLAGDEAPARVIDVVQFVCREFGLALPAVSTGDEIPESLRGSRAIDNRHTRARFAIELAHPEYQQGYRSIHQKICRK